MIRGSPPAVVPKLKMLPWSSCTLSAKGITAKESYTFRQIAIKNNVLPIKVLSSILLGEEIKEQ
jgi:hypothetical protein